MTVLPLLEFRDRRVGLRPQRLVQNRVTVVEAIEEPIGSDVTIAEYPVVFRLQIELLVGRRPLCVERGRDDQKRCGGDVCVSHGGHHGSPRDTAAPKVTYHPWSLPVRRYPSPA